jgi:uncharacterized lipoprotein NlpE involved in copper resistance
MNKILGTISLIFLFACGGNNSHSPSAVETQTTESSLRIAGTYTGMIPCADCDGIETDLKLNNDRTFELVTVYRAKDTTAYPTKGTFRFGEDGNTLICEAENYVQRYKIGENALIHLDQQGNVIEVALAEMYVLKKKR